MEAWYVSDAMTHEVKVKDSEQPVICTRAKVESSASWLEWCPVCHAWHQSSGPPRLDNAPEPKP